MAVEVGMLFRIMARSKDKTEAYAERINRVRILSDGRAYVEDMQGSYYFTSQDDIIHNPVIIGRCSADWLYKIKLEG